VETDRERAALDRARQRLRQQIAGLPPPTAEAIARTSLLLALIRLDGARADRAGRERRAS